MANEIDLGKLQDELDSSIKRAHAAAMAYGRARAVFIRAEDADKKAKHAVTVAKEKINESARALTK